MTKIVLMYHDLFVKEKAESGFQTIGSMPYKVQVDVFESHVKTIQAYMDAHKDVEVEFSFDDGGVSFLTLAAPVLEKYGLRGTFFITTKCIDTEGFLTTQQLMELSQRGHKVGGHSHTHRELSSLSLSEIKGEWYSCCTILREKVGQCTIASIPNGASNNNVLAEAAKEGIKELYTSEPTTSLQSRDGMSIIGRYTVTEATTLDQINKLIASNLQRKKILYKYKLLSTVKTILGERYKVIKGFLQKSKKL